MKRMLGVRGRCGWCSHYTHIGVITEGAVGELTIMLRHRVVPRGRHNGHNGSPSRQQAFKFEAALGWGFRPPVDCGEERGQQLSRGRRYDARRPVASAQQWRWVSATAALRGRLAAGAGD